MAYQFYGAGAGAGVGLRAVASGPSDPTLPRLVRLALARRAARFAGSMPDDTLSDGTRIRETPRVVIEYPAETGRSWTHFDLGSDFAFRSTREVVGTETITTAAGRFACVVVRTRLFFGGGEDGTEWTDWIADVGMVRHRVVYRQPRYAEDGTPLGEAVSTESVELVRVD